MRNRKTENDDPKAPNHVMMVLDSIVALSEYFAQAHGLAQSGGNYGIATQFFRCSFGNIAPIAEALWSSGAIHVSAVLLDYGQHTQMQGYELEAWIAAFGDFANRLETKPESSARIIGFIDELPEDIRNKIPSFRPADGEEKFLHLFVNYDGRRDTAHAARNFLVDQQKDNFSTILSGTDANETFNQLRGYSMITGLPEVDLLVKFSGIRNFTGCPNLLIGYSEFYASQGPWIDFTAGDLRNVLRSFAKRDRRYGSNSKIRK